MSSVTIRATGLRMPARGQPRRRLFCLPYAGGGAGVFRHWASSPAFPDDVELVAAQLPGRESRVREPALDAIEAIVAAVLPLVPGEDALPYALFGHSMGALVAFELACRLEAEGRGPSHLFVSARRAPDEPDDRPPLHELPELEFLDEMQRRYGAIPEAVRREPDLLALLLPTLRADLRAIERYELSASVTLRCPIDVYGGADDQHPLPVQLEGWQRFGDGPVRLRLFAGDHFYLTAQRDALVRAIADSWSASASTAPTGSSDTLMEQVP